MQWSNCKSNAMLAFTAALMLMPTASLAQQVPRVQQRPTINTNAPIQIDTQAISQMELLPPADVITPNIDGAIILSSRSLNADLPKLGVRRTMDLASIRQKPVMQFGVGRLNFQPVLNDPRAPFNVAQKLRALPKLATVRTDATTAYEVRDGIILHSIIRYELKTGTCTNGTTRRQVEQAGVECVTRLTDAQISSRNTTFKDAQGRPAKPNDWSQNQSQLRAQQRAVIDGHIKTFRANLAQPSQRAQMAKTLGQPEMDRLAALDDEALILELANTGETAIEQTMFVPVQDQVSSYLPGLKLVANTPMHLFLPPAPTQQKETQYQPVTQNLPERYFLTGFTLGREYEWRKRMEKSVDWCWVGCTETYYVEAYAKFGYGLGLRFPMKMWGQYSYQGKDKADATIFFEPVNGDEAQYLSTGLPKEKLFQGKEIVAEVSAGAGISAKLPVIGTKGVHPSLKIDFTTFLPGLFKGGQLLPPAPGTDTGRQPRVIEEVDFLNNMANFGVVGAKVHPTVALTMKSGSLTFNFADNLAGGQPKAVVSGTKMPLKVNPADQSSNFSLGNPVYEVSFVITPGITPKVFLDLAVWSTGWQDTIWLPQLEIELPPGGMKFGCHLGTQCSRAFALGPTTPVKESEDKMLTKEEGQLKAEYDLLAGARKKQCYDATCQGEIDRTVELMFLWALSYMRNWPDKDLKAHRMEILKIYEPELLKSIEDSKIRTGGKKMI